MSSQLAINESGARLPNYTEADVELALRLLALNGGNVKKAVEMLAAERNLNPVHRGRSAPAWRDRRQPAGGTANGIPQLSAYRAPPSGLDCVVAAPVLSHRPLLG